MRRLLSLSLLMLFALAAWPAAAQTARAPAVFRGAPTHARPRLLQRGAAFLAPDFYDEAEWAGVAPPQNLIVFTLAPPPAPPPPPARATVETTAQGVTVFRGPGTLHAAP